MSFIVVWYLPDCPSRTLWPSDFLCWSVFVLLFIRWFSVSGFVWLATRQFLSAQKYMFWLTDSLQSGAKKVNGSGAEPIKHPTEFKLCLCGAHQYIYWVNWSSPWPMFQVELHFIQPVATNSLFLEQGSFLAVEPSLSPVYVPNLQALSILTLLNANWKRFYS